MAGNAISMTKLQNNYQARLEPIHDRRDPMSYFYFLLCWKKNVLFCGVCFCCACLCVRACIYVGCSPVSRGGCCVHQEAVCLWVLFLFNMHYYSVRKHYNTTCNKADTGCLQTLEMNSFRRDADMRWIGTCSTCLVGSQTATRNKERLLKRRRHDGMDDMNLVPSTGLNNEAITFNGRTPSFHLMALIITTKYAATAAVYTVFTLRAFIILKLAAALLGLQVCFHSSALRPATRKVQKRKNVGLQTSAPFKHAMTRREIGAGREIRQV